MWPFRKNKLLVYHFSCVVLNSEGKTISLFDAIGEEELATIFWACEREGHRVEVLHITAD